MCKGIEIKLFYIGAFSGRLRAGKFHDFLRNFVHLHKSSIMKTKHLILSGALLALSLTGCLYIGLNMAFGRSRLDHARRLGNN